MSDVEKAFPAAADSTSGSSAVAQQQQQQQQQHHQQHHSHPQQQQQKQQQQQYYIKPTITANTHYCHETGHIKTSPSPLGTPATLRRQPSSYATKQSQQQHSQQPNPPTPPSPTASVCSTASTSSRSSGCEGDRDGAGCLTSGHHNCLSLILKLIFSTPGLVVLVVAYSIMGAFIFPMLEAPQDLSKSAAIARSREDCLRELWIITEKLNVLYERNWTMLVHEQLRRFEGSIVAATRHGGPGGSHGGRGVAVRQGGPASSTAVGRFGGQFDGLDDSTRWSFSEALLYSVTVITTIGHGSLTPKTAAGKIATILYALIGVPLMLMCLSSLGSLLAEALQCTYARICCRLSATTTASTTASNAAATTAASSTTSATRQGGSKTNEKKPILRKGSKRRQRRYNSDGDLRVERKFPGHGPPNVDGKAMAPGDGCKYDALGFGTYTVASNVAATGHNEESFHLLQPQTPMRVAPNQHNVGCMQQQQQQHHYYGGQQRPDVMLIAHQPQHYNRSGTPSPQHTSTYQQQQQQQYPQQPHYHHVQHQQQQTYQATSSPTTITTTSSSPPPTMQTFQLVASSVGGTVLPHHVSASTATASTSTARHFVAVPSGLLRFPPPGASAVPSSVSGPVTASTTTIYFPLSHQAAAGGGGAAVISAATTPAQVAFVASQSSPAGGGGANAAPTTVAVPFVKYHTIQFQPKKPYILAAAGSNADGGEAANTCPLVPLPPPPAYQTATVHGVRRAKFLTKPLPQEINNLLAENDIDISCRHDLSQNSACTSPVKPATASECLSQSGASAAAAPTASLLGSSTTTVDIMEDEEEHEQDRIGCPHGTPSRIPLISGGSSSSPYGGHNDYLDAPAEKSQRGGLINATAASFHRHTFQRKSSGQHSQPQQQQAARRSKRRSCFGDPGETSDEDDVDDGRPAKGRHKANEQFVLTQIDAHGRVTGMRGRRVDVCQGDGDDDDEEAANYADGGLCGGESEPGRRHVPIILVLGILICYICLGTVIFALWENWSLIDGAYFCFVTLATIGYGDFLPERTFNGPEVQLFACCAYLLLGLVLVAMSFSILETQLLWKCKRIAVRLKLATD